MNFAGNQAPIAAFLLAWAAKATILLGAAWLVGPFLHGHSAALRHRVWAIAIVSSLALPLVSLMVPAWHVTSPPMIVTQTVSQTVLVVDPIPLSASAVQAEHGLDLEKLTAAALFFWTLGTILVALQLLAGLVRGAGAASEEMPQ